MIFADVSSHFLLCLKWIDAADKRRAANRSAAGRRAAADCTTVVPPPTVDASPAQSVAIQHPLVNGLYSFPPSATSAGCVPDTLLSGLQCGVTGTFILHSTCQSRLFSFFSSSSVLSVMRGVHACRVVSVTLWRCLTAGERHGCRVACWCFSPHRDSCCVPPGDGAERWLLARYGAVHMGVQSKEQPGGGWPHVS